MLVYQRVCQIDGFEYAMISNAYPMFTFGGWNLLKNRLCWTSTKWGPQTIAKLVYNSNNFGLWYASNYSYWGLETNL